MTATPPQVHLEGRYNGTETAALLGISRRTLARWVDAGLIRRRYSKASTRPRFLGRDILRLWQSEF